MRESDKILVWLRSIPNIGSIKIKKMLEHFKNPINIWNADLYELSRLKFLSKRDLEEISKQKYKEELPKHLDNIYKHEIKILTLLDEEYPILLKSIYDPPAILFYKGSLAKEEKSIAVVGSRKSSAYGTDITEKISTALCRHDITVVSGLARGIDSYAHNAAIKANGRTIAVLGCGLDCVYPRENSALFQKIQEKGAVVSEFLPGTPPIAFNFPSRNRIISGMSRGVIVVEAGQKSGSLITADFALEQGREVFAVPGNLSSSNSIGTNRLIREGARIVTSMEDILDELKYFDDVGKMAAIQFQAENQISKNIFDSLDKNEQKIVQCLKEGELHIDRLLQQADMNVAELNAVLIVLELSGIVEQRPGKMYSIATN